MDYDYETLFQDDIVVKPLKIYCDNSAAIFFSKNDKYLRVAKHMKLKYFVVKKKVQKQRLSIDYIRIDLMAANPLTKVYNKKYLRNMFIK